jgi:hypothetical protein
MSQFRRPVSAAKNSVPGSKFGDWFDDCVGSMQFGLDRLYTAETVVDQKYAVSARILVARF